MAITSEALGQFFAAHNSRFDKCLAPGMACDQQAIRAHSIQNARVIDLIEENGHVIALRPKFSSSGAEVEFKAIGRKNASTFTGLCVAHDGSLFVPIDTRSLDISDREQLFLLAYRSVTRELHAVMDGAAKFQLTYMSRVESGLDIADELSPAGRQATEHLLVAFLTYQYRLEHFDQPLLSAQYEDIEHDVIVFDNQAPVIALSSLFSLDELSRDDGEVVRVVLNVLPVSAERTLAIFSYTKEDAPKARSMLDRVLTSHGAYQKYELSKLIVSRIENFIISPAHFRSWAPEKASLLRSSFFETATTRGDAPDHEDLMLF